MAVNSLVNRIYKIRIEKNNNGVKQNIDNSGTDAYKPKIIEAENNGYKIKCRPVKSVYLKDTDGNDVKALLVKNTAAKSQYFIVKDDETLCRIFFSDNGENIYVYDLQGQNNKGKYKGAGCELVKVAVNESIKSGYKGKLNACMADSLPFYFKNNFRILNGASALKENAFIDYMTRHPEFDTEDFMANMWSIPNGECLDEKGASALLENKRFINNSASETMYETTFKNDKGEIIKADVDFCDFSNDLSVGGSYIIQIINKEGKNGCTFPQIAHVEYDLLPDGDADIVDFEIRVRDEALKEQVKAELLNALKIKTEQKSIGD